MLLTQYTTEYIRALRQQYPQSAHGDSQEEGKGYTEEKRLSKIFQRVYIHLYYAQTYREEWKNFVSL